MKKIFYLMLLFIMIVPKNVKAENTLHEIHNLISNDNTLEVKSIPIEYYKNSLYFKECVGEDTDLNYQKNCLNYTYSLIVESYLNKTIELPENTRFWVGCDVEKNTCKINASNVDDSVVKEYNVKFISDYDEKIYNKSEQAVKKLKKRNHLLTNNITKNKTEDEYV